MDEGDLGTRGGVYKALGGGYNSMFLIVVAR
jgi:hypothetical protein